MPKLLTTVAEALTWMRDTPHWIGEAVVHGENESCLRLSGDNFANRVDIPARILGVAERLYDVSPRIAEIPSLPHSRKRLFEPTSTGHVYLDAVARGTEFIQRLDGWAICNNDGDAVWVKFATLYVAVEASRVVSLNPPRAP